MLLAEHVLLFTTLPIAVLILSGIISFFVTPTPRITSGVQHFAAGVVFVAVAVELLPDLMNIHSPITLSIGFAAGTGLMLALRAAFDETAEGAKTPTSLLAAVGIDLLIDGFLVGISFAAGEKQGILLAVALTLEVLFVGLATATTLQQAQRTKRAVLLAIAGLALLIAIGAVAGAFLVRVIGGPVLGGVLAFGAAALLYLVTEELLTEAHEIPDTPLTTALFFLGFLLFLIIAMVS